MSPPYNSSRTGWSPIEMPREGHRTCPRRGRGGPMGTDTRQRVALIGHSLSLHHIGEGPSGLLRSLPLTRARYKLAAHARVLHASTPI